MSESAIRDGESFGLDAWPQDQPFPLTDEECVALCRGHAIKWHGTIDEALDLPGRHELLNGWLILRR